MPSALRVGPYRFFFFSADGQEPPHVHVERDDARAKFWLNPVRLAESVGFRSAELNRIQRIIEDRVEDLRRSWNEYFAR